MKIVVLMGFASTPSFYNDTFPFELYFSLKGIDRREEIAIIAWSMGTLKAFEKVEEYNVKKLVLISPTRNFCLSTPSIIVKKMIKGIDRKKEKVLEDFLRLNFSKEEKFNLYYEKYKKDILNIPNESLKSHLEYLKDTNIPQEEIDIETLVILGEKDSIISNENSFESIKGIKYKKIITYPFGHSLLFEKKEIVNLVGSFLSDT